MQKTQNNKKTKRNKSVQKKLAPAAYWLRKAMQEVERDIEEIKAGRPGLLRSYSAEELLVELHS